ncbi:kinase-like domain-containing protein, partial [Coniochaeta sp. 2T2.1]
EAEIKRLHTLGQHRRIIGLKGFTDDGLYLERAVNGDLFQYLANHPTTTVKRRLIWYRQAAEAIAYVHSKRVLHCDIRHRNLLVDK